MSVPATPNTSLRADVQSESGAFLAYFDALPDPSQPGKVIYPPNVSAFSTRQRLVLEQTKVDEKSTEIMAIPKLLLMLALEGAIVTLDAMGCQRDIAQAILHRQADHVLALKGNQGSLREDVELFAQSQKAQDFADTKRTQHQDNRW